MSSIYVDNIFQTVINKLNYFLLFEVFFCSKAVLLKATTANMMCTLEFDRKIKSFVLKYN